MLFKVTFEKHWIERGTVEFGAVNKDDAKFIAQQLLSEDSDKITWESDMMDAGDQSITELYGAE